MRERLRNWIGRALIRLQKGEISRSREMWKTREHAQNHLLSTLSNTISQYFYYFVIIAKYHSKFVSTEQSRTYYFGIKRKQPIIICRFLRKITTLGLEIRSDKLINNCSLSVKWNQKFSTPLSPTFWQYQSNKKTDSILFIQYPSPKSHLFQVFICEKVQKKIRITVTFWNFSRFIILGRKILYCTTFPCISAISQYFGTFWRGDGEIAWKLWERREKEWFLRSSRVLTLPERDLTKRTRDQQV